MHLQPVIRDIELLIQKPSLAGGEFRTLQENKGPLCLAKKAVEGEIASLRRQNRELLSKIESLRVPLTALQTEVL